MIVPRPNKGKFKENSWGLKNLDRVLATLDTKRSRFDSKPAIQAKNVFRIVPGKSIHYFSVG